MYARRVGTAVLVVLCACQRSAPITVAPPPRSVFEIVWDGIQAPEFNGKLPYYELGELSVGAEYLKTMPGRVQEQAHQSKDGFEFHPDFGDVARQESIAPAVAVNVLKRAVDTMKLAFEQQETFVEDDARMLHLSRAYRRQGEVTYEPRPDRLLYVSLRRTLQGLKVDGPGSRFSAAFSGNNAQLGAVFYWRTKAQQEKLLQSLRYHSQARCRVLRLERKAYPTGLSLHGRAAAPDRDESRSFWFLRRICSVRQRAWRRRA
jgi:hypothetical protein